MPPKKTPRKVPQGFVALAILLAVVARPDRRASGGLSNQGLSNQGLSNQGLSNQGLSNQGLSNQGLSNQGLSNQGLSNQGLSNQGLSNQGLSNQGLSNQGLSNQGLSNQGLSNQGLSNQGLSYQGLSNQGLSNQGLSNQGLSNQGLSNQGLMLHGVDRVRGFVGPLQFRGIARANVDFGARDLQGLQVATPLSYQAISDPMTNVRLQHGPTSSDTDTAPGSYIFVPGLPETIDALKGTFWNMALADTCTTNAQCPASAKCTGGACVRACSADTDCVPPGTTANASSPTCVQGSCSDVGGGDPALHSRRREGHQVQLVEVPFQ
jgi:hypothetical protein